ncbi:MAG: hypothetical protein U0350_13910 [Caldilineaceae bacterium]
MPLLTRLFIKTGLLYFVAALLTGLLLAVNRTFSLPAWVGVLNPVYFHLFMVGWVTQLIIGVAYWMFPKFTREQPRGSEPLVQITYLLLNGGLLLRVLAEPMLALQTNKLWGYLLALSALLQWLAGLTFVVNTWPRVKER